MHASLSNVLGEKGLKNVLLEQYWSMEISVMREMSDICTAQYGSRYSHIAATEPLKCS